MTSASSLYRSLSGLFCLYKPPNKSTLHALEIIKINLTRELNKMFNRPPRQILDLQGNLDLPVIPTLPDLSDHPLVIGPSFNTKDFTICSADSLSYFSSGVTIIGINGGSHLIKKVVNSRWMKVYHVTCQLGISTSNMKKGGKIMENSTYGHVTSSKIDRVLSGIEASHQKHMFTAAGVDLQSEEAYQMACQGLLRPGHPSKGPVLYRLKLIHFSPPLFVIELHSINEFPNFILNLISDIGFQLRTNAICVGVRRIRHGYFDLERSLLLHQASDPFLLSKTIQTNRNFFDKKMLKRKSLLEYLKPENVEEKESN